MTMQNMPCVVSIAGTDPSGGAGIQADIKAISATGAYAAAVITALVAQNTQGVIAIENISSEFLRLQMQAVFTDLTVQAVKIGMLQGARVIEVVGSELEKLELARMHVVFDPVMIAKDGSKLLDLDTIKLLKHRMLPLVTLITPNLFEAQELLGNTIATIADMENACATLAIECGVSVLLKGGHLDGEDCCDVLFDRLNGTCHWFHEKRIASNNTHGTGCTLSAAIASYLAQGYSLVEAVRLAKHYLTKAIASGANYRVGQGCGPVDHFYFLESRRK